MKKFFLCSILFLLMMSGMAQAKLTTIGTVSYDSNNDGTGEAYNLIFEGELGSNGLVWLDYTNTHTTWDTQVAWAAGLSFSSVDVTIDSAYTTSIDWTTGWRLPSAGSNPQYGYNQTTSEMGHLFYEELGFEGYDVSGDWTTTAELNAKNFDNLIASWYWSGTECADGTSGAWVFNLFYGLQDYYNGPNTRYGLAVLSGQVSAVPVPGSIWLLGIGLTGLMGLRRCKSGNRG